MHEVRAGSCWDIYEETRVVGRPPKPVWISDAGLFVVGKVRTCRVMALPEDRGSCCSWSPQRSAHWGASLTRQRWMRSVELLEHFRLCFRSRITSPAIVGEREAAQHRSLVCLIGTDFRGRWAALSDAWASGGAAHHLASGARADLLVLSVERRDRAAAATFAAGPLRALPVNSGR